MGYLQKLNGETGQLSHGPSEEAARAYKRSAEIRGRTGQSTQEGKDT